MKLQPAFRSLTLPHRAMKRVMLTPTQMAFIIAMGGLDKKCGQTILGATGLWFVCERCAQERGTYSHIVSQNNESDRLWTMDCPCTNRRFTRQTMPVMPMGGSDLFPMMDEILKGTGLTVRCPVKRTECLTTPLTITPDVEGVTVRCQCWQLDLKAGRHRFRRHPSKVAVA